MPITRAANNAATQVLKNEAKLKALRERRNASCMEAVASLTPHFFSGWMLMFAVALVGFPLGYWPCVLISFSISMIIGVGTHNGVKTAEKGKN